MNIDSAENINLPSNARAVERAIFQKNLEDLTDEVIQNIEDNITRIKPLSEELIDIIRRRKRAIKEENTSGGIVDELNRKLQDYAKIRNEMENRDSRERIVIGILKKHRYNRSLQEKREMYLLEKELLDKYVDLIDVTLRSECTDGIEPEDLVAEQQLVEEELEPFW